VQFGNVPLAERFLAPTRQRPEAVELSRSGSVFALLSTAIAGGAANAQQAKPVDHAAPAATAPAKSADKMMLKGKWRASKLMGLDVYNEANEKLGDVNELILDKDGNVAACGD
jgi:hypothetical protein